MIPRTRLPEVLERIEELAAEYGLRVANVFHAGDGNLHPLVCYDGGNEGEAERAEELAGLIVKACVDAGGSITGEHGVGVDKKRYMPEMFDEPDLAAFQRLRCAFDPDGLANPGKVMPTPRLCGEVPGPYRAAPARGAGRGGAVLMATGERAREAPRPPRRPPRCCAAAARGLTRARRGGGTKLGWGTPARSPTSSCRTAGLDRVARAQRRRPDRRARGGRAARAGAGARSPRPGQMLALDPPRRRAARTIGGVVATGDSGPAAPPLRRARATWCSAMTRRARRRHRRARRRQGDQERRRLRPRQAVHRLVRHARG